MNRSGWFKLIVNAVHALLHALKLVRKDDILK